MFISTFILSFFLLLSSEVCPTFPPKHGITQSTPLATVLAAARRVQSSNEVKDVIPAGGVKGDVQKTLICPSNPKPRIFSFAHNDNLLTHSFEIRVFSRIIETCVRSFVFEMLLMAELEFFEVRDALFGLALRPPKAWKTSISAHKKMTPDPHPSSSWKDPLASARQENLWAARNMFARTRRARNPSKT